MKWLSVYTDEDGETWWTMRLAICRCLIALGIGFIAGIITLLALIEFGSFKP